MKDLKEGMYFQVKKAQRGDIYVVDSSFKTKKIDNYTAIYMSEDYHTLIPLELLKEAFDRNLYIVYTKSKFSLAPIHFEPLPLLPETLDLEFLHDCYKYKPKILFMSELKWKLLIRNLIKGKNIMLTGHAGTGKCLEGSTKVRVKVSLEIYNKIMEKRKL